MQKQNMHSFAVPLPESRSHTPLPSSHAPVWNTVTEEASYALNGHLNRGTSVECSRVYLSEEMVEDLVIRENRMRSHTNQKVLQPDPAALHKVWVHVVC